MKRTKQVLALLLALMMVISTNPALVFSEDISSTPVPSDAVESTAPAETVQVPSGEASGSETGAAAEDEVTPGDVHESIDKAIDSELDAAAEFIPSPETLNELDAYVNDVLADDALNKAENAVKKGDAQTDAAAKSAEGSRDQAGTDAGSAKGYADSAEAVAKVSADALEDAVNAKTREEATRAAAAAGAAASEAQNAASGAIASAESAEAEAKKAEAEYNKAQAAYDAAKAEADEKLAQGLISAQEAADLTAAAAGRANDAYEVMIAAQQAAARAAEEAAARADAADRLLDQQIYALDQAISGTVSDVAQKTGTAVLTGTALAAAKIVAGASKLEVYYYEGRIEVRQESIEELNEKILSAQAKIEAAQAVVNVRKNLLDSASDDYQSKMAELEKAEAELALAREVVANAQGILDEREASGIRESLDRVRGGSSTSEDNQKVAGYLMGKDKVLDWDPDDRSVFTLDGKYYKVFVEDVKDGKTDDITDRVLKIREYVPAHEEEVAELPAPKDEWSSETSGNTQATDRKAYAGGDSYEVVIYRWKRTSRSSYQYRYQITVSGEVYEIKSDSEGFYYITASGDKQYLTIKVPVEAVIGDEVSSSIKTAERWDAAEHAKDDPEDARNILIAKRVAYEGALDARNLASLALGKAQLDYDIAKAGLNYLEDRKTQYTEKRDKIQAEVNGLDQELNGNLAEQFVVAYLDGGTEGLTEKLVESIGTFLGPEEVEHYNDLKEDIADLSAQWESASALRKVIIAIQIAAKDLEIGGILSNVAKAADLDLTEIEKQGAAIKDVINAFSDGNINMDDVKAVGNLITSSDLSINTKRSIINKIVEFLETAHQNAVIDLKTSVRDGAQNISIATVNVVSATGYSVAAHANKAVSDALSKTADALAADAADKSAAADKAAEDAAKALTDYKALAETYGPDDTNVTRAREASEAAQAYADAAADEAERAKAAAVKAESNFEAAMDEAGRKADPVDPTDPVDPADPVKPADSSRSDDPADPQDGSSSDGNGSGSVSVASSTVAGIITAAAESVTELGKDIAAYAASLRGSKYASLVGNDKDKLNSKAFVDHVYSHFDIQLDLEGKKVETIAKNGRLVDNSNRKAGDLLVITNKEGIVTGFAVNYNKDKFVQFNKKTGKVEILETKTLKDHYSVVRIA